VNSGKSKEEQAADGFRNPGGIHLIFRGSCSTCVPPLGTLVAVLVSWVQEKFKPEE